MNSIFRISKRTLSTLVNHQYYPEYFYDYAQYSFKLIETTPPICKFCNKPITKFQCMSNMDIVKMVCPMFKESPYTEAKK